MMRSGSTADHWHRVYSTTSPEDVGWYQSEHDVSLKLITESTTPKGGRIINIGCGASTVLDDLINQGFQNLTAVDICDTGLASSRERLGESVTWIVDDVTQPEKILEIEEVDLWHDRAVLHFFTSEEERLGYLKTLRTLLKVGGHAVIETFSLSGAEQCSGLDLRRYDKQMLADFLGPDFELIRAIEHTHTTPGGGFRPYISTLFRRIQ